MSLNNVIFFSHECSPCTAEVTIVVWSYIKLVLSMMTMISSVIWWPGHWNLIGVSMSIFKVMRDNIKLTRHHCNRYCTNNSAGRTMPLEMCRDWLNGKFDNALKAVSCDLWAFIIHSYFLEKMAAISQTIFSNAWIFSVIHCTLHRAVCFRCFQLGAFRWIPFTKDQ